MNFLIRDNIRVLYNIELVHTHCTVYSAGVTSLIYGVAKDVSGFNYMHMLVLNVFHKCFV